MGGSDGGRIAAKRAAWLADGVLLAVADSRETAGPAEHAVLAGPLETPAGRRVMALQVPPSESDDFRDALTDLQGLLREELAHEDAATRREVIAMLAELAAHGGLPAALGETLHTVREGLRERRPTAVVDERTERGIEVDALHRVAPDEYYVRGSLWEREGDVGDLAALAPEGERISLLSETFRFPRPETAEEVGAASDALLGFACRFQTRAPSGRGEGWVFEVTNADGRGAETTVGVVSADPAVARAGLVGDACEEWPGADDLREHHLMPALTRLEDLRRERVQVADIRSYGAVPETPAVSIVVPLYARVDLLEHQLVQFADEPEIRECELLYVLDSPEQAEHLTALSQELAKLYEVPFRVATLTHNGGVATARNLGAESASGRILLFLDSDVLPAGPGWVGELVAALGGDPATGAVAPKLVYEDGGVQHAGLTFERMADGHEWGLEHRFKGLHGGVPAVNEGGTVPAVTGSCLMVSASVYRELDGMRPMYVQGDYEDADLCMRLRESGRACLYVPEVTLIHLEAQSYPPEARAHNRRYNRWLFTREWGHVIARA